jgi:ribosome-associated translation inhibitor RaiA
VNIEIRGKPKDVPSELKKHAVQRLHLSLSRYSNRIRSVRVLFEKLPTAPQGPEKRCIVSVKLDFGDELTVEDSNGDAQFIIDNAVDRVGRLVARELERQRDAANPRASRFPGSR